MKVVLFFYYNYFRISDYPLDKFFNHFGLYLFRCWTQASCKYERAWDWAPLRAPLPLSTLLTFIKKSKSGPAALSFYMRNYI